MPILLNIMSPVMNTPVVISNILTTINLCRSISRLQMKKNFESLLGLSRNFFLLTLLSVPVLTRLSSLTVQRKHGRFICTASCLNYVMTIICSSLGKYLTFIQRTFLVNSSNRSYSKNIKDSKFHFQNQEINLILSSPDSM